MYLADQDMHVVCCFRDMSAAAPAAYPCAPQLAPAHYPCLTCLPHIDWLDSWSRSSVHPHASLPLSPIARAQAHTAARTLKAPCRASSLVRPCAAQLSFALSRSRALALSRSRTLALALVHFSALALSWPAASLRDSLRGRTACPPSGTPLASAASSRLALPRQPLVPRAPRRRSRDSLRRAAARCTPRY